MNLASFTMSASRTRRALPWLALFPVLSSVAFSGCSRKAKDSTSTPPQAIAVAVITAFAHPVAVSLSETGSFVADESSDVASASSGKVIRTPVSVGAFVKAGEVLCELDHRDAQLKLTQTESQLAEAIASLRQSRARIGLGKSAFDPNKVPEVAAAKANYESAQAQARLAASDAKRYANLVSTGDVSQSVYEKNKTQADTAAAQADASRQQYEAAINTAKQSFQAIGSSQAALEAVQAQIGQAQKSLSDTTIRAPFDGFVSARPISVGEFVSTSTKVATVVRIGTLKLQLQTPEKNAAGLKVGMPVAARVAAYADRDFQGTTSAINPAVDPQSRAFILEARFANGDGNLRPGMFATARVSLPRTENAVFLPATAIVRDNTTDSNQVFVVESGKVHLRIVSLGETSNGQIRILSGVLAGESVVSTRQADLYEGALVTAHTTR